MEKSDRRNTYQYKLRESKFGKLKKLGSLMVGEYKDMFKRDYDFPLAPTLEEFAHIFHIPDRDQIPYIGAMGFPEVALVAQALRLEKNLVKVNLHTKGNVRGFTSKFLLEKATLFASSGSWDALYIVFSLLIYGLGLFPKIEGFVDKIVVSILISRNLVSTLLDDVFFSFHWRNQKRGGTLNYCIPLLYKWILTHLPRRGPFADNFRALKWSHRLMSLDDEDVVWYYHDYDRVKLVYSCEDFPNIPLVSSKGGVINYNSVLSLCQLGYQLKEEPKSKFLEEFLIAEKVKDANMMKRIRRAWGKVQCIGKKELGKQNYIIIESYKE
ncbi:uncharacterized protein LOC127079572 [Lathyrus oleraceus]|uniref:uncharacterized protein LOC127079572 n=1 Tax=Pisum sativum TaxID=3888 RepID=UPI0021CF9102|nr:uncharacterized protein LOC127079572 [Pisum sativum]